MIGHFARICKKAKSGHMRERGRMTVRGGKQRINVIEHEDSQSGNSHGWDENNFVLHVDNSGSEGNQPLVLKGKINKNLLLQ